MTQPTVTHKGIFNDDVDRSTYTIPSVTFAAGSKVILWTVTRHSAPVTPTAPSGACITGAVQLGSALDFGSGVVQRLCAWEAEGTGSAGTIALVHSGTMWGFAASYEEVTHPDGTPEVVQNPSGLDATSPYTGALAALQTDSVSLCAFAHVSGVTYTQESPYTLLGQVTGASPNGALCAVAGAGTAPVVSSSYSETGAWFAVEVGVPGGVAPPPGDTETPTPTLVTAGDSAGSSATSHNTAAFLPEADVVYVVDVVTRGTTVSSVSGGGITYTKLREIEVNPDPFTTADINISRWYGKAASPSSAAVTITLASSGMASWTVTKLVDGLATGTNGVDAFGSGDTSSVSGASAGVTMTPAAFAEPDSSAVLVTAAIIRTGGGTSHDLDGSGDGLTELAQNGMPNAERTEHATYWKVGEDTSVTVAWTNSGPILASVGIADEIKGAPVGAPGGGSVHKWALAAQQSIMNGGAA